MDMVGHEEGLEIVRARRILVPLSLEEVYNFCLEMKGEGEGGVEGVGGDFEGKPLVGFENHRVNKCFWTKC